MEIQELEWLRHNGMTIDLFAGGGGFSTGFESAIGRPMTMALNHDRLAVTLHAINHPQTVHLCQDIWQADPVAAIAGRPTFWIHASPSCTQFSRSRRALPADRQLREMAWRVLDWVDASNPVIVTMENVGEMRSWGPLGDDGFPIKERAGETWEQFVQGFRDRGYQITWRMLDSADYGAPTARTRLFIVARRDGIAHEWPEATHGPGTANEWTPAAKHIDWDNPAPSIFTRKKPLADATMIRIWKGIKRFVTDAEHPFYAPKGTQVGDGADRSAQVAAFLGQNHALLPGRSLRQPASTICTKGAGQALITASFMSVLRNNAVGIGMDSPIGTMTASGGHFAEVRVAAERTAAFCTGYFSEGGGQLHPLEEPIGTMTTRDRFAIVTIHGMPHRLIDIGYRMLTVKELWPLAGFPAHYKTNPIANGKPMTEEAQKRMIGNAVVPHMAEAVTRAILASIDRKIPMRMAA